MKEYLYNIVNVYVLSITVSSVCFVVMFRGIKKKFSWSMRGDRKHSYFSTGVTDRERIVRKKNRCYLYGFTRVEWLQSWENL